MEFWESLEPKDYPAAPTRSGPGRGRDRLSKSTTAAVCSPPDRKRQLSRYRLDTVDADVRG